MRPGCNRCAPSGPLRPTFPGRPPPPPPVGEGVGPDGPPLTAVGWHIPVHGSRPVLWTGAFGRGGLDLFRSLPARWSPRPQERGRPVYRDVAWSHRQRRPHRGRRPPLRSGGGGRPGKVGRRGPARVGEVVKLSGDRATSITPSFCAVQRPRDLDHTLFLSCSGDLATSITPFSRRDRSTSKKGSRRSAAAARQLKKRVASICGGCAAAQKEGRVDLRRLRGSSKRGSRRSVTPARQLKRRV
jgi:hypothetical protein